MGIIKLLERVILGKKTLEGKERTAQEIKDMERELKSKKYRKEMLTAYEDNMKISAKTRKIQKETWKIIKEIEKQYPQIYGH